MLIFIGTLFEKSGIFKLFPTNDEFGCNWGIYRVLGFDLLLFLKADSNVKTFFFKNSFVLWLFEFDENDSFFDILNLEWLDIIDFLLSSRSLSIEFSIL